MNGDATWSRNHPDIPPQFNRQEPPWTLGVLHGDGDRVMWWQIEGATTRSSWGLAHALTTSSVTWIGYVDRLVQLNNLGMPVYVHCRNGTDRTGASVAAFAMREMGYTLDEAFKLADSVKAAGTMNSDYVALVKAYVRESGLK